MKNLYKSFLVLALSLAAVTTNAAEDKNAIFQYNNGNMLNGDYITVSIRDNGDVHALRVIHRDTANPKFDDVIGRLDRDQLAYAKAGVALVLPSMKLRELTKAERERNKFCAMDSAVSYSVPGKQFEYGRLVVRRAIGCGLTIGLDTRTLPARRAEAAMKVLARVIDQALVDNYERIYK